MATLVHNPSAVSSMADLLGRMNISPQDLPTTDEKAPFSQTLATNVNNDLEPFFFQHNTYEPPQSHFPNGGQGHHYEPMLDLFDYTPPSEYGTNPLFTFPDVISTVSTLDLSAHRLDDLSAQLDGMAIDDTEFGSCLISLPEPIGSRGSATSFGNTYPVYPVYTTSSASPPLPSFDDFLAEAGIDLEQYEELERRYSPDFNWELEDIPLGVREYQKQTLYLAQVGDLCNQMEGISMSQVSHESASFIAPAEFDMPVAQDHSDALGLFTAPTEDQCLTPLDGLICFDSLTNGGQSQEVESALWATTS